MTAVQLPQIDIPVPQKPQIDLPTVPAVPVYQFQVPDIKSKIEDLGQTAVDKVKGPHESGSLRLYYTSLKFLAVERPKRLSAV